MNNSIKNILLKIFEEHGIYIRESEFDSDLNIDSFVFVAVLVAIEETFMIALFDTNYDFSMLQTFNDYYKMIEIYL